MEISEVRIKLMEEPGERLQAFCSITFDDCFVIRDLKIIEGSSGPFVAMPSRKLTSHCPQCGAKNHLRAAYCNQCGLRLKDDRAIRDTEGRAKLYADIAHPINSGCREMIQIRVIQEFRTEQERAKLPGYVSHYDDLDVDDGYSPPGGQEKEKEKEKEKDKEKAEPLVEPSRVQSAHEPPPPHKSSVRSSRTEGATRNSGRAKDTGFGAGIF